MVAVAFAILWATQRDADSAEKANVASSSAANSAANSATEIAPDIARHNGQVKPLMQKYCADCHDANTQEGDVRFDTINPDLVNGQDVELWKDILRRLETLEMPPKDEAQPSDAEREAITQWIRREIQKHVTAELGVPGRVVVRRLSRNEYRNTLRDLLGLHYDIGKHLDPDTTYEGYDHVAAVQELSPTQLNAYLKLARFAIDKAIPTEPRPITAQYRAEVEDKQTLQWRVQLHAEKEHIAAWPEMQNQKKPKAERLTLPKQSDVWEPCPKGDIRGNCEPSANGVWLNSALNPYKNGWGFVGFRFPYYPKDTGLIRVRIKAGAKIEDGRGTPLLTIHILRKLLGHFEITADANNPQWHEFIVAEQDLVKHPFLLHDHAPFHKGGRTDLVLNNGFEHPGDNDNPRNRRPKVGTKLPELFIDAVEIEFNYTEPNPTPSQQMILFKSPNQNNSEKYAEEVLTRFMSRAFRRPVRPEELAVQMDIYRGVFKEEQSLIPAIKPALIATLVSPQFLFLFEDDQTDEFQRRPLNDYEFASRLSYFLWSTMPDDELLQLAAAGKLRDPDTLRSQVDRMLRDDRADAFYAGFMTQWLGLDLLDELMIEDERWRRSYQLKRAIRQETISFFAEVARQDLSLMNLIDSEFAVINERMALHYKIPGVYGQHFRPVKLDPKGHRGGLLTQASCLALTTDGMITSPIYRGKWVLEKILDMPPPEAPANVPPLEDAPNVRLSLREQFAKHREDKNCAACHARIDPVGWPFEQYSLLGEHSIYGWGSNWREFREKKSIEKGLKPDMHGILPDGTRVETVQDLQQVILQDYRQDFLRSVVKNMMIYALGRPLDLSDDVTIQAVIERVSSKNDRTRELIQAIVESEPFLEK